MHIVARRESFKFSRKYLKTGSTPEMFKSVLIFESDYGSKRVMGKYFSKWLVPKKYNIFLKKC